MQLAYRSNTSALFCPWTGCWSASRRSSTRSVIQLAPPVVEIKIGVYL